MVGGDKNEVAAAATPVKASSNKRKGVPARGSNGASKKIKAEVDATITDENDNASAIKDDAGSSKGGKVDTAKAAKVVKVEPTADAA